MNLFGLFGSGFSIPCIRLYKYLVTATRSLVNGPSSFINLNSATPAIVLTMDKPQLGQFVVITQIDTGTAGHTVKLTSGTFDGTNNTATFNAQYETLVLFGLSATRYAIIQNLGSVGLSAT